jgi:hypothetical protein
MNNTPTRTTLAAIVLIFTAATLLVGAGTLVATPSASAFPYNKGQDASSKNDNPVTIQYYTGKYYTGKYYTGTSSDIMASGNRNPVVFPPNSHPYGLTYGQWSTEWWQWAVSIPSSNSPITDTTGENCDVNQQGKVWFLAGTTGNPINKPVMRTCTIPVGKAILFPIINGECSTAEGNGDTEAELRACAKSQMDGVTFLQASIDGVPLKNLKMFRAVSPLYKFTAVEDNPFGIPAGTTNSVADGFWVMLPPLRPGTHTISFGGSIGSFSTSVEYELEIVR